jgi:hypothetical protein
LPQSSRASCGVVTFDVVVPIFVLRPTSCILRLVPCCPAPCYPTSCLFIQHLFDFCAIFVCHGSFPIAHFILQIVRCVRIL